MTHPTVRAARESDAAVLAALRFEFRGGIAPVMEEEPAFLARCAAWMGSRLAASTWRCWVAQADDTIVGTAWLHLRHGFGIRDDLLERRLWQSSTPRHAT